MNVTDIQAAIARAEEGLTKLPPEVLAILEDGGLIPHVVKVLAAG